MTIKRTKKTAALALIIGAALAAQGGCKKQIVDPPEELPSGYVTVTFHPNGGEMSPQTQTVMKDDLAAIPRPAPLLKNHTFAGWYTDNTSFLLVYDFKTPVREPLNLYAKWTPGSQSGVDGTDGMDAVGEQDAELSADEQDFGKGVNPEAITRFTAANKDEWDVAITAINNAGDGTEAAPKNYVIDINGNFKIPGGYWYTDSRVITFKATYIRVSIRGLGDGRELSPSSNGSVLVIEASQTLIIRSLTLKGIDSNNNALVTTVGAVYLRKGAKITGNTNTNGNGGGGGGVQVYNGSLIMRDNAEISGNTTQNNNGGGVYIANGTVVMRDTSTVSGNICSGDYKDGGGIMVDSGGVLTLRDDAAISGNRISQEGTGGGVHVNQNGLFIIRDKARIFGNATGNAGSGGGVSNKGACYIGGGTIYGSDAEESLKNKDDGNHSAAFKGYGGQYGLFSATGDWVSKNALDEYVDTTIAVVNGVLQPLPSSPQE